MKHVKTLMFTAAVLSLAGCGSPTTTETAQTPDPAACVPYKDKFCPDVQPGEGRVVLCLLQYRDQLSAACLKLLGQ